VTTQGYRFAKSTRTNIISQLRQWLYFCSYFRVGVLPATALNLCLFMELMSNSSGYPHCKNVLSGIKFLHGATGHKFPEQDFLLETTMQGLKRKLAGTPKQVLPIDPVVLRRMFLFVDTRKVSDLCAWVGFLLAFYCLFRKANLCPKSSYDSSPSVVLKRGDIEIDDELGQVLVYVNFSKTNQYMHRSHVIPIPRNDDPALDLFSHIKLLFSRVKATPESPALSYSAKQFINHRTFTEKLKVLIRKAGLDPSLYSGHSFRRGGASYLYSIGGTTLMVQVLGEWSSQVYTRYLALSVEDRLEAQELMSKHINGTVGYTTLSDLHHNPR
jgi:hypothetical protein